MLTLPTLAAIGTPNLVLREIMENDSADMACFMTQRRYQKYIAHRMKDANEVKLFVARQLAAQGDARRNVFHLAAEERHSSEVVGDGFLICHHDDSLEIGWRKLASSSRNKLISSVWVTINSATKPTKISNNPANGLTNWNLHTNWCQISENS